MDTNYALYYSQYCYFCQKVLMSINGRADLDLDLRNTSERQHHADLVAGGGKTQVPCLRIDHGNGKVEWMYESDDIIRFLANV